jgi:hypothetical protein
LRPLGVFRIHGVELVNRKRIRIIGAGPGGGYGDQPLLNYEMRSGFLFTGASPRVTRTRALYRGSASDPVDPPLSVGLNIQSEFSTFRDFTNYLWFKRPAEGFDPAAEKDNFGSDRDCAFFIGCRVRNIIDNVHAVGYWRRSGFYEDLTRATNLPQFSGPDGVPFEVGTVPNGGDGTVYGDVFTYGPKWGIRRQGAMPKPGLPWYGYRLQNGAIITVSGTPTAGQTLTLNGVEFTFVAGTADAADSSTDILIGATPAETAANIAETAETYTVNQLASGVTPGTRSGSYFADGALVRIFQRDGVTAFTLGPGGSNPFTLVTTSNALTLSDGYVQALGDQAPYYDDVAAAQAAAAGLPYTAGEDRRGTFGGSDWRLLRGWIYGPEHHSLYRIADATGNYLADAATCGGCLYISGMAGNQSRKIQGMESEGTRFSSWEAFRIFVDFGNRVILNGPHIEYHNTGAKTRSGAAVQFKDSDTYGPIALTSNARNVLCIGLNANVREAFIPSNTRFQNIAPAGSRQLTRFTDVVRTGAYFETARGLRATVRDLDYRTLDATGVHRWRGGSSTWLTLSSSGLTFGTSMSSPVIAAGAGDLDLRASSTGNLLGRIGNTTKFVLSSAELRLVDGRLRLGGPSGPLVLQCAGSPEGQVAAPPPTLALSDNGNLYKKAAGSGTGNTGWEVYLSAGSFSAPGGSDLIGYSAAGTGAVTCTVRDVLRERVSVTRFMTAAQISDVQMGTLTLDVSAAINAAWAAANQIGADLEFPFGPTAAYRCDSVLTGQPLVLRGSGAQLVFNTPAGRNGITFLPATVVGARGGIIGLELVARGGNGATAVEMPKQADQYSTYFTRWVFRDLYCRGSVRNVVAYSFAWDYGFATWFRLSDCAGLEFSNITVHGAFDIKLDPSGQFQDSAVELDAASALLTARIHDVNFGPIHTAVKWGDKCFFSLSHFDIIGAHRGIYQSGTVPYNEPKIHHGNINAQDVGIYFNGPDSIDIDSVTVRRHSSGWKGGSSAWYGIKALNASDVKVRNCTVQPDESAGAFTGTMTGYYLSGLSLSVLEGNFVGVGNDIGVALDNCTGVQVVATTSAQNSATDVLFNLTANTRITTIGAYELVSSFAGTVLQKDGTITGAIQMLNKSWDLQGTSNIVMDVTRVNAAADTKKWRDVTGTTSRSRQTVNDAGSGTNFEIVSRTGTVVDSIEWRASKFKLNNGPEIYTGSAAPEGSVSAPTGSIYLRTSGGAGTTFYVKESGSGNTGWIGK